MKSMKVKHVLFKKSLGKPKTDEASKKYVDYRNVFNKVKRRAKEKYYADTFSSVQNEIKKTWSVLNKLVGKNKNKSSINCIQYEGNNITEALDMSNVFCKHFSLTGSKLAAKIPSSNKKISDYLKDNYIQASIYLTPCSIEEILKIITSLKNSKSTGHDNLNSTLIKGIKYGIVGPLSFLINRSFESGIFPDSLKIAKVVPLYKGNEKHLLSNYRPISLLTCFSKIYEKVIHRRLTTFLEKHKILCDNQYGFRPNHSTTQAVTELSSSILSALSKKEATLAAFLDLSKAFETLHFDTIFHKLSTYGIRGKALDLIKSYLKMRKMYVSVNNCTSDLQDMNEYGVPQGSVLGPLIFILYINDMQYALKKCHNILFADDTTIFIHGKDIKQLYQIMNSELKELNEWFKLNSLSLNVNKSCHMLFTRNTKNSTHQNQNLSLVIGSANIKKVSQTTFLGIVLDEKLSWECHIKTLAVKLSKGLYALQRSKHFLPKHVLKIIYFTMCHSHLEYGNVLWGDAAYKHLKKINTIQKRAVRVINKAQYNAPSSEMFQENKILKLKDVYKIQVHKTMYNIYNHGYPSMLTKIFKLNKNIHAHNTRQTKNFNIDMIKYGPARKSILYNGPKLWNALPNHLKHFTNIKAFCKKLKMDYLSLY
jgi:hypothetical protein